MLIADGGGGSRPTVVPTVNPGTTQRPASTNNGGGTQSDAAARARELQRQIEAMLERIREMQRQAAEARKRALEAQQKAEIARKAAEAAREKAEKSKAMADELAAKRAEQEYKLADARMKKANADVQLKDKEIALAKAQVAQKKEQKKSADGTATAETDKKVKTAQDELDAAKRTSALSNDYLDYQEKETKAVAAEAKVQELTPVAGRPSSTVTQDEWDKLKAAQGDADKLRKEADAAKTKFMADVPADVYGPASTTTTQGGQTVTIANDPLHSPLQQFLQVSATMPLENSPGSVMPGLTPAPAATEQVTKTLNGLADGKTVQQIADERGVSVDVVVNEAKGVGVTIESGKADQQTSVTVKRGDATLVYTKDAKDGSLSVKATFADPKAPGSYKTVEGKRDQNGTFTQTIKDDKTGDTVTHVIDPSKGTRTDTVLHKDGSSVVTTTDLTGAAVYHTVKPGEDYLEVAKKAGLTPEQLLALNPDVDYGKPLKDGQQLVVSGVRTTTVTTKADHTKLEKTVESNGSMHVVATTKDGHQVTLMGDPGDDNSAGEKIRKGLFEQKKSIADMAKEMGMTEDQVLEALPPGTVNVTQPSADNNGIRTRTIYDPVTNKVIVETYDARHDHTSVQVIDDSNVFKVRQYDPDTKQFVMTNVTGGLGYLQKLADDRLTYVGDLDKQIADLDVAIRYGKRMREPVADMEAQRQALVERRKTAQGEADIAQARATSALVKNQQVKLDKIAANAYARQFVARPGSQEQKDATKSLEDILALVDKVDRLKTSADKDIDFLIQNLDRQQKHDSKVKADDNLRAAFQEWKSEVWMWEGVSAQTRKDLEEEGSRPAGRMYASPEQENEEAWKAFQRRMEYLDENPDAKLRDGEQAARNAWVARKQASDAELKSNDAYYKVSIDKGNADANVIQGDIDRLQSKKDAWTAAHPQDFSENFPGVKGDHGGQGELDMLNDQLAQLKAGVLLDGKQQSYNKFLMDLSVTDREDPDTLKKKTEEYGDKHAKEIEGIDQQVTDIMKAGLRNKAKAAEDYIAQWAKDNPALQGQLDTIANTKAGNVRMADHLIEQREDILNGSHEGQQLKSALAMKYATQAQTLDVDAVDLERINGDLKGIDKTVDGQTWLRDVFSDKAEDSQAWTQEQRDKLQKLRDDLSAGRISLTEYNKQQDALMDSYGFKSIDVSKDLRRSNETWAVVDDAVRMTVTAAAGIAATIATGGNVAAGIAVGVAVNQLWDTSNDVYAAANGRDIYADGHSSLVTLGARATFDNQNLTREQVMFTLKDDAVDTATAAVSATGVGAGMRTSAALTARIALRKGVDLAAGQSLKVGSRMAVGAGAGTVGQTVDATGRVGVEALHVKLDGQWGTDEGNQRIMGTVKSGVVGLAFAPGTGAVSGFIPLNASKVFSLRSGAQLGGQFLNDAASSLGIGEVNALWTDGRGMNQAQFISASLQALPGTMTNVAFHPSRVSPRFEAPSGEGFTAAGLPKEPTSFGRLRTWEDVANHANGLIKQHDLSSQPGARVKPPKVSTDEAGVFNWLSGKPVPHSGARFVVSTLGPADTIFGSSGGMRVKSSDTYKTFEEASAAAAKKDGAWVHRVQPSTQHRPLYARGRVGSDEIVGAIYVNKNGDAMPVGIPNTVHAPSLVNATGRPGWIKASAATVKSWSGPTKALTTVSTVQGGAIAAKMLGSGWFFDNVTGGAWATWLNQTRGLGTRSAYFTGKRGLENALELASQGKPAEARAQIEIVANRRAMRGLSPEEIAAKKQKALDQLGEFGDAAHRYLSGAELAGVPDTVTGKYSIKLLTEAETKAGTVQVLAEMPDGTLVAASSKAQALAYVLGDRNASPGKLAEAVDAWRTQQSGGVLTAAQQQHVTAMSRLKAGSIDALIAAREGELGYGEARTLINTKGNLINMKDVQGALGSTMHMGSRVGVVFKYGALGFAANSGLSGTYALGKQFVQWNRGKDPFIPVFGHPFINMLKLSGEVVGNVPNVVIQWNYLRGLQQRTTFSDTKVPLATVERYLQKRAGRMERLENYWWGVGEKLMTTKYKVRAETSIADDKAKLAAANAVGDPAPGQNLNLSKWILMRKAQAKTRAEGLRNALANPALMRAAAAEESTAAAKSMNTAGDFMTVPSMFRYTMMALGATSPLQAAITVFHGIASNGGWLRSQQGKGTIYGIKMSVTGIEDGNGLFGVGKRIGRGYNNTLDFINKKSEQWLGTVPGGKADKVVQTLKLEEGAEAAANRRRIRLLLSGAIVPTYNLLVALLADDGKKKEQPLTLTGSPGIGPWNTATHAGDPRSDTGFKRVVPEDMPELEPIFATVDGHHANSRTLWGLAGANADTLLADPASFQARVDAGPQGQRNPALAQLFNLNPKFDPALNDGKVTNAPGDPDTLLNGWQVQVGERWVTA